MGWISDFAPTILGGVVGFAVGGPAGAAVGAGVGASISAGVGQAKAGEAQAEATGQAAVLQQQAAQEALAFEKETRELARAAALPSIGELASIDRLLELREGAISRSLAALDRQDRLLQAVDPALQEAGRQALDLLQGKEVAALAPIREQRDQQRRQLENTLAAQLGSGFRTSSAGMEALARFDQATDTALFNAQQATLGQLLGISAGVRPDPLSEVAKFQNIVGGVEGTILGAQQNITARQVAAITGAPVSFQNIIATAGAPVAGEIAKQQQKQQFFGGLVQLGGTIGTAALTGAFGDFASGETKKTSKE